VKQYAKGGSITDLYIASLHEIEDNFVLALNLRNNSTYCQKNIRQLLLLLIFFWGGGGVASKTLIFKFESRNKLQFHGKMLNGEPFYAAPPGNAAPP
jgi:hypothetical protein